MSKKDLCVDFDGVIHSYISGWKGIDEIPDDPVPGALPWLRSAQSHPDYQVHIYSSRSKDVKGVAAMKLWMLKHGLSEKEVEAFGWPTQKPPAYLTLDDRAICFQGTFPSILEMDCFRPWTGSFKQQLNLASDRAKREEEHKVVLPPKKEFPNLDNKYPVNVKKDWDHLTWDDCAIEFKQVQDFEADKQGYEVSVLDNDGPIVRCWVYLMEWSGPITSCINRKDIPELVRALIECQRIEPRKGFMLREEKDNE